MSKCFLNCRLERNLKHVLGSEQHCVHDLCSFVWILPRDIIGFCSTSRVDFHGKMKFENDQKVRKLEWCSVDLLGVSGCKVELFNLKMFMVSKLKTNAQGPS